ncbi:TPA: tail fiber domain-containing protein [Vibrio cholerae]
MAMNIEQRLEQSAKSIEQSSQKAHDFAEKDTTLQTCAGSRDSLPKVSRIWQENFARQMNQHATEFQDRFALSQQSLPWQAGITISDSLQRYHVGVQGEEGYKEFLPNPVKLPFETAATLAEDLTQDRWLENGVPNKHWTESKVASALEKSLGVNARIWPKDRDLQVGDVIPAAQETADGLPITHVIVDGNAYAMIPLVSGLVLEFDTSSAKIADINVELFSAVQGRAFYTLEEFGALGFPNDDTIAFEKVQSYFDSSVCGLPVIATKPAYLTTKGLIVRAGHTLEGQGCDYWDTFTPNPESITKSMEKGTTILLSGSGAKTHTAINLDKNTPAKTGTFKGEQVTVELLDFNNGDSVNGAPATPRHFSVGIVVNRNASLKNIRVVPNFNGIDGYNDPNTLGLGADWDVGLWIQAANESLIDNVQAVGYFRMVGTLMTENDGTFTDIANPERCVVNRLRTQGVRGLAIRNSAQWAVISNTADSITCEYNQYWTLTSQNKFELSGSGSQQYTFTGYTQTVPGQITLIGVTPPITGNPLALRSPVTGNNFAGTVFNDCVAASLEHRSGSSSVGLGLPEAAAFEISGYPMRGLKFINFKAQTTYDRISAIFGDCRDVKIVNGQIENGLISAVDRTESRVGYTGTLEFVAVYDKSGNLVDELFTPAGFTNTNTQLITDTDKGASYRPPVTGDKNKPVRVRSDDGEIRAEFRNSGEDSKIVTGRNFSVQNSNGESVISLFGTSKNISHAVNIATSSANAGSCGTASVPYSAVYATNGTIQPSDAGLKTEKQNIPDGVFRAWGEVRQKFGMWMWLPEFKESDRYHFGPYAQDIVEAFERYGEDPYKYALNCYDEWKDEYDDDGALILEGGKRLGIKPHEIFMLEIAYNVWKETAE